MQAYCMKCKTKREMKDPRQVIMKNGRPATQGTCPVCGTKLFLIGKKAESEQTPPPKPAP
jgi:RNase P subunit RPR2